MRSCSEGRHLMRLLTASAICVMLFCMAEVRIAGAEGSDSTIADNVLVEGSVTLESEDGFQLSGTYFAGRDKGPGVVLVHMDGRSSLDWKHFGEKLGKNGFHVIAIDLRGHGRSTVAPDGSPLTHEGLTRPNYEAMVQDVGAAVRRLRDGSTADPDQIAIVGASVGANLAIRYAASDERIANVVMLSPGLEYKGINTEDAVTKYGERPLLIAVSREDNYSAKSSLVLDAMARGKKRLQIYTGAGHGTKMLSREPGLETMITAWLNGTILTDDDSVNRKPSPRKPTLRNR